MLRTLELTNFRNHPERRVELGQQTVIVGKNGAGKTAILEAVAMLSLTTSWRASKDSEVVAWDAPFARIVGDGRELVIQRKPYYKRIRIDGISKRAGEVVGTLPTVLFHPDDSQLVTGSPAYRRAALDRLLSQSVPGYMSALSRLQRILKQRNKLLKLLQEAMASRDELQYWDGQLAAEAATVRAGRATAIPRFAEAVAAQFSTLVPDSFPLTLSYDQSPKHAATAEGILQHLQDNHHKEVAAGVTLYGPQREDILFSWGGHPAVEALSRGQIRAVVLAFKMAEVAFVEETTGLLPIFLLDDVYSEFDRDRRQVINRLITGYQSILTTTEVEGKTHDTLVEL